MSYRPFMPFLHAQEHYTYPPPVEDYAYYPSSNCSTSMDVYCEPSTANHYTPEPSFAELQEFCNRSRNSIVESVYASSISSSDAQSQYNVADLITVNDGCFPRSRSSSAAGFSVQSLQDFCNDARSSLNDSNTVYDHDSAYIGNGHEEEDDDGADWFDIEALGLNINDLDENELDSPTWRFDFPLPMLPVVPVQELKMENFDGQIFYVDNEGYVQVYTQGECRVPFHGKASIGVWFGPNHPSNVSECLHRGRRTQEAARFAAVIEAIRVAGSHGITKLQINTDYENIIRFMLYFILKWEQNDWMTLRGHHVKNRVLIRELDYFSRLLDIKWNLVPSYEYAEGNLEAAQLAIEALDLKLPKGKPSSDDMDVVNYDKNEQVAQPANGDGTKKRRFVPIVY
ncbi:uncharacterized protein LOC130703628 [Daphnia carinata]|uniref:uncharacterized protein LOC130703628 n=1 Tax=Daphnia carinata TaxID=120202 RepID=UPI0028686473|nr:uncharacterized protein LOC130703628 [Daphnia carinata]